MLQLVENIINTLLADSTIKQYVNNRIYPNGVDIYPEAIAPPEGQTPSAQFPMIAIHTVSEITRTVPLGHRETVIQVSIFSRLSQLEVEEIAEQILSLLNFQNFYNGYGNTILFWQRQDSGIDLFESDRRIWHKALSFRAWAKPN